jgi:hypothetical protein
MPFVWESYPVEKTNKSSSTDHLSLLPVSLRTRPPIPSNTGLGGGSFDLLTTYDIH